MAAQVEAVRVHITALTARVDGLIAQRDGALHDARQLARLVRHLFLSTGAEGFTRPGIQALLAAHLTGADRQQLPTRYEGSGPDEPSVGEAIERQGNASWQ
ncbi:hypothetical protein [Cellulomonas sp. RIT-PI-Y]|uniref:hypothetical protein n=1 Tax=Cellulomonas sp. RIT-PI-Y TaxID=3035297 RepID=UPI0021D7DD58|nr:hypothetical protein [Cellulomonas sp. RIT-PI-Y]